MQHETRWTSLSGEPLWLNSCQSHRGADKSLLAPLFALLLMRKCRQVLTFLMNRNCSIRTAAPPRCFRACSSILFLSQLSAWRSCQLFVLKRTPIGLVKFQPAEDYSVFELFKMERQDSTLQISMSEITDLMEWRGSSATHALLLHNDYGSSALISQRWLTPGQDRAPGAPGTICTQPLRYHQDTRHNTTFASAFTGAVRASHQDYMTKFGESLCVSCQI